MIIAISGTHCVGKSTLVDEFLSAHPDFAHEPEPYAVMVEDFGEEFSDRPCVGDFSRQLDFNVDRLRQHKREERVIFERCPIDFLAYIETLDSKAIETAVGIVSEAIRLLDLIVYLPIDNDIEVPDAEYPKLRRAVDRRLSAILRNDEFGIISSSDVVVVEAGGSTTRRLQIVEEAIKALKLLPL